MLAIRREKRLEQAISRLETEIAANEDTSIVLVTKGDTALRLASDMDGWDYVACSVAALVSAFLGSSKEFEGWLAEVHDAASGSSGDYDVAQKALGKLFEHSHDNMDWFKTREDGEANSWRLFHRLFWGHDPLSTSGGLTSDNPFVLMFNQAKEEGRNGLWGILQASRHLMADTFSKQGLPLPGSSHFDYSLDNGRPWNHLIDIVQQLSVEAYGNKAQAEALYEHLLTIRAQDLAGGMAVCAMTSAYLKARNVDDEIRAAQIRLVAYSMGFFMQALVGAARQKGVPYINVPLGVASAKSLASLLVKSNVETYRLGRETNRLIGRKEQLLERHTQLSCLIEDELRLAEGSR